MTYKEAKDILRVAAAEVEWNCPLDYTEAFKKAEEALDKQIPLKPLDIRACPNEAKYADCPICGQVVDEWSPYCDQCGQRIDWGDDNG